MATQNNEKESSQQIGIQNQPGSTNYGKQIVIQNNFVINLKNYVKKVKINPNFPYKESSFLPFKKLFNSLFPFSASLGKLITNN